MAKKKKGKKTKTAKNKAEHTDFVRKHYAAYSTDDAGKGFGYGVDSVENDKEMKAFYAGVGFGKSQYNERIGFEHEDHRKAFERGVKARKRHLTAYKGPRKQTLFEKFFKWLFRPIGKSKRGRKKNS